MWRPGFTRPGATRFVIVEKSREFERNNALFNRLVDLFEQYTVGASGLVCVPSSSDPDWNKRAKKWISEWWKVCNIDNRHNFSTTQSLIAREWFVDGEVFVVKCFGKNQPTGTPPRPRIQLVESHRIGGGDLFGASGTFQYQDQKYPTTIDGIEYDESGRPVAYNIKVNDTVQRLPADSVEHIFEPSRIGQLRGLPFAYPVMNDITDLDDLQRYEMMAAKSNAVTASVITNQAGEMTDDEMARQAHKVAAPNSLGVVTDEDRMHYYRQAFGGETKVLKTGDKYEVFRSDRPGVAQQNYWDHLTAKVCAGTGITRLLVFPYSMQGTVVRADLDSASTFFRSRSAVLASFIERIYLFAIEWGKDWDPALKGSPKDWNRVVIRPPRSVNVDIGRNSSADLADLSAGNTTYQTLYAERGDDWAEQLTQKADEAAFINRLAKERSADGVTPGQISELAAQEIVAPPAPEQTQPANRLNFAG
jgi:lambda family phage portal protein